MTDRNSSLCHSAVRDVPGTQGFKLVSPTLCGKTGIRDFLATCMRVYGPPRKKQMNPTVTTGT